MYLHSNTQAQWYHVLNDLQEETSFSLPTEVEHYLMLIFVNSTQDITILDSFLSQDFFLSFTQPYNVENWQDIGDKCLVLNGLFPDWTCRRVRSKNFVTNLGKLGYCQAALQHYGASQKLFEYLSHNYDDIVQFLKMMNPGTYHQHH